MYSTGFSSGAWAKVLDYQTSFLITYELLRDFAAVGRKLVLKQENVAVDVAQ